MTSLLIEIPPINRDHATVDEDNIESFEDIQETNTGKKSNLRLVEGITVEEVLHSIQYQIIPYVTEIANIWVMGSAWIVLINEFVEKLKGIN